MPRKPKDLRIPTTPKKLAQATLKTPKKPPGATTVGR